jgi:HlyD family secretion protein
VKEYATTVEIVGETPGLRPGMTAKVAIRVESIPDAVQVPIQAVVERGGKHYCLLVRGGSSLEPREVLVGSTNENFLVIRDGLSSQDEVLINPRVHLEAVHLPEAASADGELAVQSADDKSAAAEQARRAQRAQSSSGGPGS